MEILLFTQLTLNNLDKALVRITFQFILSLSCCNPLYQHHTLIHVPGNWAKLPRKPFYQSEQDTKIDQRVITMLSY